MNTLIGTTGAPGRTGFALPAATVTDAAGSLLDCLAGLGRRPTLLVGAAIGLLSGAASPASAALITLFQDDLEGHPNPTSTGSTLVRSNPPEIGSYVASGYFLYVEKSSLVPTPANVARAGQFAGNPSGGGNTTELNGIAGSNALSLGQVVKFTADVYVPTNTSTNANAGLVIYFLGLETSTASSQSMIIRLLGNGNVTYQNINTQYNTGITSFTRDAWTNLAITANYSTRTFQVSVGGASGNGTFIKTAAVAPDSTSFHSMIIGNNVGSTLGASSTYYLDNLLIEVPEPSMLALMAGLLGLTGARQRRRPRPPPSGAPD